MAIDSSSPVAPAALPAKLAASAEAKSKLPGFGPGTPVYPPGRLPPQPRDGVPPQGPKSARDPRAGAPPAPAALVPSATASPAVDPRAELAENNPFPLSGAPGAAAPDPAQPSLPALTSRGRLKTAAPAKPPGEATLQMQVPALLNATTPADPAPVAAPADSSAAAPPAAEEPGAGTSALAQFATGLPANLPSLPAARGPAFGAAPVQKLDTQGATGATPAASAAATLVATDSKVAPPVKSAVPTPPTAADPSQHNPDTQSGSTDAAPEPAVLSVDFTPGHLAAEPPAAAPPPVQTPVGVSGWTEEVGAHVIWMAHQGVTAASLRLQPEHLGPLEVKISLHEATASVWFGANEPETRTALQAALPQLKEMFAAQGMTLTDAGVSREPPRETPQLPRTATQPSGAPAATAAQSAPTLASPRRGLIDTYA